MSDQRQAQLPEAEQTEKPAALIEWLMLVGLLSAILFLFLFARLAGEMREGETAGFDLAVRGWIHQFASPAMTQVMKAISLLGYDLLILELVIAVAIFLRLRWRRAAAWLAITMTGAVALDVTLKHAFHRSRPVPFFGDAPHSYSFPSGHALASFCFYGALAGLIAHRLDNMALKVTVGLIAAVLVLAIGVSRIYLGVHYPSDVVAGYLAAAMWVSTMLVIDRAGTRVVARRRKRRLA